MTDEEIITKALWLYVLHTKERATMAAQKHFRLPSGRKPTGKEINGEFDNAHHAERLWRERAGIK